MSDKLIRDKMKIMLQQLSIEQLLELLRQEAMSEDLSDDYLYAAIIMEVIEEKEIASKEGHLGDVSQSLRVFETKYNTPEGEGQSLFGSEEYSDSSEIELLGRPHKKYRKLRHILAAAVIGVVILSLMIPAVVGSNIFSIIGRWTSEWFRLEQIDSNEQKLPTDSNIAPTETEFETLQDAFDACGIMDIRAPQWLPEGYSFVGATAYIGSDYLNIAASYSFEGDFLMIAVDKENTASVNYQKDSANVEEFYYNGVCHYIFSNNDNNVIVWFYEDTKFMVTAPVGEDTLKEIVKSMYYA